MMEMPVSPISTAAAGTLGAASASGGSTTSSSSTPVTSSYSEIPTGGPIPIISDTSPASNTIVPVGKPRRPHHKSRTGCMQCKQRKVKCDETKPVCKKCQNHNQSCSYLQTHPLKRGPPTVQSMLASPSPTSSTPNSHIPNAPQHSIPTQPALPANFTMLDLEILHHWTARSVEAFVDFDTCVDLFRVTVVEMGFDFPFLMHEILALTAIHMSIVKPHKAAIYRLASDTHLATALSLFQPEITNLSLSNCHACWAFSTMVFTHAWASQEPTKPSTLFFAPPVNILDDSDAVHVQWIKLHRGSHFMLRDLFPSLKHGPLEPLFAPWKGMDQKYPYPLAPEEEGPLTELLNAGLTSQLSPVNKDTISEATKQLCRVFSLLTYNPEISKLSAVMSWFSMITDEFLKLLEDKLPEALLIAAYYCVALKRAENMWWVRGKPENLLRTVIGELPAGCERWTRWPVDQVLTGGGYDTGFIPSGGGFRFGKVLV